MECERKFLVDPCADFGVVGQPSVIRQGYVAVDNVAEVRVRMMTNAVIQNSATLCVKELRLGAIRGEYAWNIPLHDAEELLELASGRVLHKKRWKWGADEGGVWILDVFEGHLDGLVLAEWECSTSEEVLRRPQTVPTFVIREVTEEPQFRNHFLATSEGLTVAALMGS